MEKRKNNARRISIGVLLTFALLIMSCLAVLPMTVSAAEGEPTIVSTEAELTEALAAGGNIQLGTDITVTAPYTIYKENTVTLDLSGFTLDMGANSIYNHGTFELRDSGSNGSLTGSRENVISNYGLFTLTSGTVRATNSTAIYISGSGALMVINGGVVSGGTSYSIEIPSGALTLNGGRVTTTGTYGIKCNGGSITINSGEIEAGSGIFQISGSLNMTGGTISATNWGIMCSGGTVTLGGGTIGGTIKTTNSTLLDCLAAGNAFYDENGNVIPLTDGQTELAGTVTVGECNAHVGGTAGCTTLANCAACGLEYGTYYHADDDQNGFCDECGKLPITEATFPDANFRTYIAENIDTDKDGLLSTDEIAAVTELDIYQKNITTLEGAQYFTNLEMLNAGENGLTDTALNFSMLADLYALNLIGAFDLESLDVSGCTKLNDLRLDACISLTSLDLRNNLVLYSLNVIHASALTSLDLSVHENLNYLNIDGTTLTSLKLHPNADVMLYGEIYKSITHCGVGYVNLGSIVSDLSQIVKVENGTLGTDGWLKLDDGVTYFMYYTATGNTKAPLPHGVSIDTPVGYEHTYIDQPVSKDATGHYAQSCSTCRTVNEESVVAHTIKYDYTTKYTDSQHREYCTDCDYLITEACNYASDCEENCSECRLTTRVFFWEEHTLIYTTYIDGDDDSRNDSHKVRCANCSSLNYASEFCYYAFACSETCVCGRANPNLAAHTTKYVVNGNMTHDALCEVCAKQIADDATCVYEETVNDAYVASPATCISGTTYYKSCDCGHKSNDTFVSGEPDAANHDWNTTDVCSGCNAVKISEKTFPDEKFRNFILGEFFSPLNEDGIFTLEELQMVKRIAIDVDYISDLTGVAYFTELTTLTCYGFQCLKPVDLSQNTKLTEVDFGLQLWHITIAPDATFDLNTLGIDVSKLTLPEGCTVNNGIIKFGAGVYDLGGLTYPSGYGDTLFEVRLAIENPHTHASVETFDDCTKQEVCLCGDITKAAKAHTPEDDDGDCTTDILCSVCDAVATKGNEAHTGGTATCTAQAVCADCGTKYGSTLAHTPEADDGNCTTEIKCSVCKTVTTPASVAHTGGTATCQAQATCDACGEKYGNLLAHDFTGAAQKDADGHQLTCTGCGATDTKRAHAYGTDTTCNICGYETAAEGGCGQAAASAMIILVTLSVCGICRFAWKAS